MFRCTLIITSFFMLMGVRTLRGEQAHADWAWSPWAVAQRGPPEASEKPWVVTTRCEQWDEDGESGICCFDKMHRGEWQLIFTYHLSSNAKYVLLMNTLRLTPIATGQKKNCLSLHTVPNEIYWGYCILVPTFKANCDFAPTFQIS
jgi:hypothetical protein